MDMGNANHVFGKKSTYLVIFGKSAWVFQPTESTFYNPSFGDDNKYGSYAFGNVYFYAKLLFYRFHKRLEVALVATEFLDGRVFLIRFFRFSPLNFFSLRLCLGHHSHKRSLHFVNLSRHNLDFRIFLLSRGFPSQDMPWFFPIARSLPLGI